MPLDIVPEVVSPPCTPEAYQLTPVFVVPVTEAVNVCDFPADTVAVAGEIETDTAWLPMVTASEDDAVVPFASFTISDGVCVPAAVGVPVIVPLPLIERPAGKPVADQMYGAVPPVAVSVAE